MGHGVGGVLCGTVWSLGALQGLCHGVQHEVGGLWRGMCRGHSVGCIEHCRGLWYGAGHGAVEAGAGGMPGGTAQGTRGAGDTQDGVAATGACPPTASCTPRLSPHHGAHAPCCTLGLGGPGQSLWPHLTPCAPPAPSPAYCCNALDGRWYSYDDSRVEGVQEAEVSTRSAYILFYQRRNAVPAWSASSSVRGERPHLPARLRPDSARAPRGHRPGHARHGRGHARARRVRYTHGQQSQTACAFSTCTRSVGCAHRAQLHMHRCTWTRMHTHVWAAWQVGTYTHTEHSCVHAKTCTHTRAGTVWRAHRHTA